MVTLPICAALILPHPKMACDVAVRHVGVHVAQAHEDGAGVEHEDGVGGCGRGLHRAAVTLMSVCRVWWGGVVCQSWCVVAQLSRVECGWLKSCFPIFLIENILVKPLLVYKVYTHCFPP